MKESVRNNSKQKLSKEEIAERRRKDRKAHERDRERKRMKRLNPAYRLREQERDRERKKVLRSDETFRAIEKIRDRLRKERKRCCGVSENINDSNNEDNPALEDSLMEPEVVISSLEQHQQHQWRAFPQQYNGNHPKENPTESSF